MDRPTVSIRPASSGDLDRAMEAHRRGDLAAAVRAYRALLRSSPDKVDAVHLLGLALHQQGDSEAAEHYLRQALEQAPGEATFHQSMALCQRALGNAGRALEHFQDALARNPDYAEAHYHLGNFYLDESELSAAIEAYGRAIELVPDYLQARYNQGLAFQRSGKLEQAHECFLATTRIDPAHKAAQNNLGHTLESLGKPVAAIGAYRRALEIDPGYVPALYNLGHAEQMEGRADSAEKLYWQVLRLDPDHIPAKNNLGQIMLNSDRPDEALKLLREVVDARPGYGDAWNNIGVAQQNLGQIEEAEAAFLKAIELHHNRADAAHQLARLYASSDRYDEAIDLLLSVLEDESDVAKLQNSIGALLLEQGDQEQASNYFLQAIESEPSRARSYLNLATTSPSEDKIAIIEQRLKLVEDKPEDAMHFHFALARLHQVRGNSERSFEHYQAANALKRSQINYDEEDGHRFFDRQVQFFDRAYFDEVHTTHSESDLPVFVVGMPRSGTSLTEQILASHPEVFGGGERMTIQLAAERVHRRLAKQEPYPDCMALLEADDIRELHDEVVREYVDCSGGERRVVDKLPGNYLYIGVIKTLFPRAKIIHCARDPMDTCTSIFCNYFVNGHHYSFDQRELGRQFVKHIEVMQHWYSLFGDEILTLRYEEMVADQEGQTRRLLDYVGLEWSDECLNFHEADRAVRTASNLQVRKPMYSDSVGRWRVWEEQLAPLAEELATRPGDWFY